MIKFGTDGWRAKIGEDFTFDNVRIVAQALADHAILSGLDKNGIAVGFDNRFESEHFAASAAEVCAANGLKTFLSQEALPSPALSFFVKNKGLDLGIMITASHNPAEWNGFKIKENFGGSARLQLTQAVEKLIAAAEPKHYQGQLIEKFDPKPEYFRHLRSLVDFDLINSKKIKVVFDPMFGSGAGYLSKLGLKVDEIHGFRNPLFGGLNPEPLPLYLDDLASMVKELSNKYLSEYVLGIAVDGDADRIAGMDEKGNYLSSHNIFCLLLRHLIVHRKMTGQIIKTFNITRLIDKMAVQYGRKLFETPIGFKYIADLILKEDILIGGEESGGIGIKGHIPERDGILNALLLMELVAYEKRPLGQILDEIMRENGYFYYNRADIHTDRAQEVVKKLFAAPPNEFGKMTVKKVETLDGLKLNFEDQSWILFRASGTEPLLRIYVEARTPKDVALILSQGENLIRA